MRKHNVDALKEATSDLFLKLKSDYGFDDFKDESQFNPNVTLTLVKDDLLLAISISALEGYNLFFLKRGDDIFNRINFSKLKSRALPIFSEERKEYSRKVKERLIELDPNSKEYYLKGMEINIDFLNEHFPEILKSGKLP